MAGPLICTDCYRVFLELPDNRCPKCKAVVIKLGRDRLMEMMEMVHSVQTQPLQQSSVEISMDSKGTPRPTVKVYDADADQALETALRLYKSAVAQLTPHPLAEAQRKALGL